MKYYVIFFMNKSGKVVSDPQVVIANNKKHLRQMGFRPSIIAEAEGFAECDYDKAQNRLKSLKDGT